MTDRILHRDARNVEVRFAQRRIDMLAVPYDEETNIGPYFERFQRGVFNRSLDRDLTVDPVRLMLSHRHTDSRAAIGILEAWQDRTDGLFATFEVLELDAGDEALTQADSRVLQPSVGFAPRTTRDERNGRLKVRTDADLVEVSLTPFGAYKGAKVAAVRDTAPSRFDQARAILAAIHRNAPTLETTHADTD